MLGFTMAIDQSELQTQVCHVRIYIKEQTNNQFNYIMWYLQINTICKFNIWHLLNTNIWYCFWLIYINFRPI